MMRSPAHGRAAHLALALLATTPLWSARSATTTTTTTTRRTVEYTFNVTYFEVDPDHHGHTWVQGVNGMLPGPEVRVKRGDRLKVTVNNFLGVEELSVHWHGFEMRGAQEYDGAMGLTQCGIRPGDSFTYDFVVDEHPGTYQYHEHAHIEHVAARGMFGPLIVEPEDGKAEPFESEYDQEATLMLMDWWRKSNHDLERSKQARVSRPGTVSALGNGVGLLPFHNLLINGKGAFNVFGRKSALAPGHVTKDTKVSELAEIVPKQGETWRLRIVNGGALFAMRFRIDGHKLRIVQADAADVEETSVDAISMSSGERFDVLVTFDQPPGSYWMRVETLEHGPGLHHGQLGVVRYNDTQQGVRPTMGFPLAHKIQDAPQLVTMNCIDQEQLPEKASTCKLITELRRLNPTPDHVGTSSDATHDFEVSMRGFTGEANAHFTRLIDLTQQGNHIGVNQHQGEFVQFHAPYVPYSHVNGTTDGHHKNTLSMHVNENETVRVVLQLQDRAAHPWHLHGHKFAVLGVGFPNYNKTCDVLFCRSTHPQSHWISRDSPTALSQPPGWPALLDPEQAPLKDTVHVPAGGWVVLQFKADNPGWWFFHCHMLVHVHDGMGLVLIEAPEVAPSRLTNLSYLEEKKMPSCSHGEKKLQKEGSGMSCSCWQNPEMKLDNLPLSSYRCSQPYLCGQDLILEEEVEETFRNGARNRADGRPWRIGMLVGWLGLVAALFVSKWLLRWRGSVKAQDLLEMVEELRYGEGDRLNELVTKIHAGSNSTSTKRTSVFADGGLEGEFGEPAPGRRSTGSQASVASYADMLTSLPSAGLPLRFEATIRSGPDQIYNLGLQEEPAVSGELPPGSVLAILGPSGDTEPWLRFFAGRRQHGKIRVSGDQHLGGEPVVSWSRRSLRQARGYISGIQPLRPSCTVAEFLELPLLLVTAPDLYTSSAERTLHMVKYVKLFKLEQHLQKRLRSLDDEVLLKVLIAQETVLPRGVLMIKGPLDDLRPPAAIRMMKVIKLLAVKLKVTIVFSCDGCIPREAGKLVTHAMMLGQSFRPFFTTAREMPERCASIGLSVPPGTNVIEWGSEIVVKGLFDAEQAKQSTSSGGRASTRFSIGGLGSRRSILQSRSSDRSTLPGAAVVAAGSPPVARHERSGSLDSLTSTTSMLSPSLSLSPFRKSLSRGLGSIVSFLSSPQEKFGLRRQKRLPLQLWTLLRYQFASDLEESITIYRLMETCGIGVLAGLVWFQKGSVDTQTALGETIGLLFFSTALYTVPPVFQVLAVAPSVARRVSCEHLSGMYPIHTYVISMTISSFITVVIWAPVWQMIAYTFADLGKDPGAMLLMQLTLALNVISMRTVGYALAMVIPSASLNVVIANLFVQMCMLTNGFYTKLSPALPEWTHEIVRVSVPRYTLRALLKIEYSWRDTFEVHPMHGLAAFGHPSRYIPAELTGTFQLMHERNMNVMNSPEDSSPMAEMLVMAGVSVFFMLLFTFALVRQVWTLEERLSPPKEGGAPTTFTEAAAAGDSWAVKQMSGTSSDAGPTLLKGTGDRWAEEAPATQQRGSKQGESTAADTAAGPALAFTGVLPYADDCDSGAENRHLFSKEDAHVIDVEVEDH